MTGAMNYEIDYKRAHKRMQAEPECYISFQARKFLRSSLLKRFVSKVMVRTLKNVNDYMLSLNQKRLRDKVQYPLRPRHCTLGLQYKFEIQSWEGKNE